MAVTAVSHIPIGVRDLDASLRFWRDFMGMEVTGDTGDAFPDRRSVFLRWDPEKTQSSVFMSLSATLGREPSGAATAPGQLGVNHLAFWVDDLDACIERAKEMSFEVRSGPMSYGRAYADFAGGENFRTAMVMDPDGVMVQLEEWH